MFPLFNFSSIFPGGQLTLFVPVCGRPCSCRVCGLHVCGIRGGVALTELMMRPVSDDDSSSSSSGGGGSGTL